MIRSRERKIILDIIEKSIIIDRLVGIDTRYVMSPKIVDKEKKKREIIGSAMEVFAGQGINNFKMINIAKQAKIGKGTIYEYFTSKDDLIAACFGQFLEEYESFFSRKIEEISDPADKIRAFIDLSFDFFAQKKEILRVVFDFWSVLVLESRDKSIRNGFYESYLEFMNHIASILNEGITGGIFKPVDTKLVASILLAMMDGILFQVHLGLVDVDDRSHPEKISKILLDGIRK
jgi:TetR/AcrR family fatty acid metabolism transcriptional regulator